MDEVLRDPIWTSIGAFFAIIAILVAIVIFFAQRKIKRLSYEMISNTQLLGVKDEIQGKVKVLYEGNEVKNVHLLSLKFLNTGNQPISSSDYERPLTIKVNPDAKILTYEIVKEEPENLGVKIDVDEAKLICSPVLLNSKDSFLVKTLISDFEDIHEIDGRIIGVKSISKYVEGQATTIFIMFSSLILMSFRVFGILDSEYIIEFENHAITIDNLSNSLFGVGYILLLTTALMLINKKALISIVKIFK